ncbi:uncharacterized protein LOC111335250 [Stylophora pistillata]|uniref:uncharacterized protein LOC111335250 n=1 Tax=Stylophora pistillata TaxID=50429 RepID=UPI000C03E57D|nr:uncharacterized protein LOC111335250 [Stylophora pistillata]
MVENEKPWPEPAPDWPEAKKTWKLAWPFHVYLFTALNVLVVIRGTYELVKRGKTHFMRKDHRFLMNLLLLAFGLSRTTYLLWNPYESDPDVTKTVLVICIVMFGIGTACIVSAFSFVLLIVLESTRISLAPSKFQNRGFFLGLFIVNVIYVIVSDLIVAHFHEAKAMIVVCQVMFAAWGFLIAFGFTTAAVRLWRNLKASRQTSQYGPVLAAESMKITRLVSLLYSASFCGVLMFSTIVYSAFGATGVNNKSGFVRIWPWIVVKTLMRTLEVLMCLLIYLVALKTKTSNSTKNNQISNDSTLERINCSNQTS